MHPSGHGLELQGVSFRYDESFALKLAFRGAGGQEAQGAEDMKGAKGAASVGHGFGVG